MTFRSWSSGWPHWNAWESFNYGRQNGNGPFLKLRTKTPGVSSTITFLKNQAFVSSHQITRTGKSRIQGEKSVLMHLVLILTEEVLLALHFSFKLWKTLDLFLPLNLTYNTNLFWEWRTKSSTYVYSLLVRKNGKVFKHKNNLQP